MTVRIYKSTDLGAPQIALHRNPDNSTNAFRSNIPEIMQKCLVDGYGSKQGAGWTINWQEVDKISVKQGAGGDDLSFVFEDNFSGSNSNQGCAFYGASKSVSENDYSDAFPQRSTDPADWATWIVTAWSINDNQRDGWTIIASPTFVYYFKTSSSQSNPAAAFFGSMEPLALNSSSKGVIFAPYATDIRNNSSGYKSLINKTTHGFLQKDYFGFSSEGIVCYHGAELSTRSTYDLPLNPITGKIDLIKYDIYQQGTCKYGYLPSCYIVATNKKFFTTNFGDYTGGVTNGKKVFRYGNISDVNSVTMFIEYDE